MTDTRTYLALDPSGDFGWALWRADLRNPVYGHWTFKWGCDGDRFNGVQKKLHQLRSDWGGITAIRMEFNSHVHLGERAIDLSYGWKHAVAMYAAAYRIPFGTVTTEGGWRLDFIGRQEKKILVDAERELARKEHREANTRDKLKLATIARCRQLGWDPKTTDEADALGVLDTWLKNLGIQAPWYERETLRAPLGVV